MAFSGKALPSLYCRVLVVRVHFLSQEQWCWNAMCRLSYRLPQEFQDLMDCLQAFTLKKSAIMTPGGGRSPIPLEIDGFLSKRGWAPKKEFNVEIAVDGRLIPVPTHRIDNFKHRIGVEVEWNNKTEFYDRDLNNFRLLKELRVLSVGVIITRLTELQGLFNQLSKGSPTARPLPT
jgi:hypothetical protein